MSDDTQIPRSILLATDLGARSDRAFDRALLLRRLVEGPTCSQFDRLATFELQQREAGRLDR